MTERGPNGTGDDGDGPRIPPETREPERLGNPTRLVPRQAPPDEEEPLAVTPRPAVFEDEPEPLPPPPGFGGSGFGPFGPRSFGNGRIQVWGCSPGCLIASLIGSVVLTLLLNAMF
jgi:hypothetical protein